MTDYMRSVNPPSYFHDGLDFGHSEVGYSPVYAIHEGTVKKVAYDYFCTGHYAMVVRPEKGLWGTDKKPAMIACALDDLKDQTYFLYRLDSNLLEKVRFPLAFMKKSEVFTKLPGTVSLSENNASK